MSTLNIPPSAPRDEADMIGALKGNVGKMELVAMELKQSGCYLARTLSYQVE